MALAVMWSLIAGRRLFDDHPAMVCLADDTADGPRLGHLRLDGLGVARRYGENDPETHVEGVEHVFVGYRAALLDQREERGDAPRRAVEVSCQAVGQNARDVVSEAAAGDVRSEEHTS